MNKKKLYVVTETIVNFEKKSVDTFVIGVSEELDGAKSIMEYSLQKLLRQGCDGILLSDTSAWKWAYKSTQFLIKNEIALNYL